MKIRYHNVWGFDKRIVIHPYPNQDFPAMPEQDAYEQTSLHCYKADRRLCHMDVWMRNQEQVLKDAAILEMRLSGLAF